MSSFAPANLPTDPHSYSDRSLARVHHLALALTVNFDQHILTGTVTWYLANPGADAELVLDTRDLTIEAVAALDSAGQATSTTFTLGPPDALLGQPLTVVLALPARRREVDDEQVPVADERDLAAVGAELGEHLEPERPVRVELKEGLHRAGIALPEAFYQPRLKNIMHRRIVSSGRIGCAKR